ncbi:MAG TPA: fibronectin type III domain-containing protein [Thermoanaerobaculia bacterium]|nr:fibronectin type III domain-containing protein [Thermoanaerobaculia bacterium]
MNTSRRNQSSRGYSIAEVLVATAIFTIIMVAALLIYDRSNKVFKTGVESGDMQQNTRIAFDRIVADIRMAGYDFDRDGIPFTSGIDQQPDEQIEFMDRSAIVIRGNFDAELNNPGDTENGRDVAYQAVRFPVVTTGNDEIVAYVLRSDRPGAPNNHNLVFHADVRKPRRSFTGAGGADEMTVTIPRVDLCRDGSGSTSDPWNGCKYPPYTLYRVTLKDRDYTSAPSAESDFNWSPIASNVRRLQFTYYNDPPGLTTPLTPNQGAGKFLVSSPTPSASLDARYLRETIQSIRVEIIGMNASPDAGYASPIESTLPAAERLTEMIPYRQYRLSSLVVPRNLGRRGIEEYATNPPGKPVVTGATYGCCGVVKVTWSPPPSGVVDGYSIIYDTSPTGAFASNVIQAGMNNFGYVPNLDPSKEYFFKVVASNSFGSQPSDLPYPTAAPGIRPKNRTKMGPPTAASATADPAGNKINLQWTPPTQSVNNPSTSLPPTWADGSDLRDIPSNNEIWRYRIYRGTTAGFAFTDPGVVKVWDNTAERPGEPDVAGEPVLNTTTGVTTWVDNTPKVNCKTYYYRVQVVERCFDDDSYNEPASGGGAGEGKRLALSVPSDEFTGQSIAAAVPATPINLSFLPGTMCPGAGTCTVLLSWPEVTQDTASPPNQIQIEQYRIERVTLFKGTPDGSPPVEITVTDTPGDGTATYTDTPPIPPSADHAYQYRVRAEQCSGTSNSAYSVPKVYPCLQMTIIPPGTGIIDGDGSAGNPWLIGGPSVTIGVTTTTAISSGSAALYRADGSLVSMLTTPGYTPGGTTAAYDVPMTINDGALYYVDITMTDSSGCSDTARRYMIDSPTACCLAPYRVSPGGAFFDSTIVTQSTSSVIVGATNYAASRVLILKFRNMCDESLTLQELKIRFPTTAGRDLVAIRYPTATGTVIDDFGGTPKTSSPAFDTPPASANVVVPANSSSYEVALVFSRNTAPSDLQGFCATYQRSGVPPNVQCQFAPAPSTVAGVCD